MSKTTRTTKSTRAARPVRTTTAAASASARQIWRAGLGAFALAGDEGARLFAALAKRGEKVERLGRARLDEMFATVSDRVGETVDDVRHTTDTAMARLGSGLDATMTGTLHTLGIPTRREIAGLTKRVEQLTGVMERRPARPKKAPARRPRATRPAARSQPAGTPPLTV